MGKLTVRDFRSGDLQAAADLLASAQARAAASGPAGLRLGERFLDGRGCRNLIEQLLVSPRATSLVAEADGRLLGYLAGERQLYAPEDFASIYAEPRSTSIPLHGHAIAADADQAVVYEALYGALARRWVADGFFVHNVAVRSVDREALEAWAQLGFGRKSVCAIRPTTRLEADAAERTDLVIEEVRGRDDEILDTFHRRLMTFQTGPPMFWPYTGESDAKVRAVRRDALINGQGFAYIARAADGQALGSLLFVPSVFLSPLLVCEKMVYLWEGFVDQDHRADGVGSALLDFAMARLHERDVQWCALHYVSGNPRGGRFWPARGFVAVESLLHRHVDERVAWAKGFGP